MKTIQVGEMLELTGRETFSSFRRRRCSCIGAGQGIAIVAERLESVESFIFATVTRHVGWTAE